MRLALVLFFYANLFAEENNQQDLTFEFIYDSAEIEVGEDSVGAFYGSIINISSGLINIAVVRRVDVDLEDWTSSICIGSLCYNTLIDSVTVDIESGDTASIGVLVWTNGEGEGALQLDLFNNENSHDNILFDLNIFSSAYVEISNENQILYSDDYIVFHAYPNPFNPVIRLDYFLRENSYAVISIFDARGRTIKNLKTGYFFSGKGSIKWDGTNTAGDNISAGVYFCRIQLENQIYSKKIMYVK